jgi:hypothetical protein
MVELPVPRSPSAPRRDLPRRRLLAAALGLPAVAAAATGADAAPDHLPTFTSRHQEESMTATPAAATPVQPFRAEAPEADLDDLRRRLAETRWPDE